MGGRADTSYEGNPPASYLRWLRVLGCLCHRHIKEKHVCHVCEVVGKALPARTIRRQEARNIVGVAWRYVILLCLLIGIAWLDGRHRGLERLLLLLLLLRRHALLLLLLLLH